MMPSAATSLLVRSVVYRHRLARRVAASATYHPLPTQPFESVKRDDKAAKPAVVQPGVMMSAGREAVRAELNHAGRLFVREQGFGGRAEVPLGGTAAERGSAAVEAHRQHMFAMAKLPSVIRHPETADDLMMQLAQENADPKQ